MLSRVMNPAMAEKALHLLRNGYNVYEVAVKLTVDREVLVEYFKSDPDLMEKATQARREGADALVATYKDLVCARSGSQMTIAIAFPSSRSWVLISVGKPSRCIRELMRPK